MITEEPGEPVGPANGTSRKTTREKKRDKGLARIWAAKALLKEMEWKNKFKWKIYLPHDLI